MSVSLPFRADETITAGPSVPTAPGCRMQKKTQANVQALAAPLALLPGLLGTPIVKCASARASGISIIRSATPRRTTMKRVRNWVILLSGVLLTIGGFAFAAPRTVSAEPGTGLAFG